MRYIKPELLPRHFASGPLTTTRYDFGIPVIIHPAESLTSLLCEKLLPPNQADHFVFNRLDGGSAIDMGKAFRYAIGGVGRSTNVIESGGKKRGDADFSRQVDYVEVDACIIFD